MLSDVFHLNHFRLMIHSITGYSLWSDIVTLELFLEILYEKPFFPFQLQRITKWKQRNQQLQCKHLQQEWS